MSIRKMSEVWASPMPPRLKLPAIALADMADDDGRCWPSVPTLCRKTGQSERTMQGALAELEQCKALRREVRPGRSTVYFITPADFAPPQEAPPPPADLAPPPPQELRPTPAEAAPRIVNEPSTGNVKELIGVDASRAAQPGHPPERKNGKHHPKVEPHIAFNALTKAFEGITEADTLRWQEAYHLISVPDEIAKLAVWQAVNPPKKNVEKFIQRNLARAQERAENKKERREIR